MSAAVGGVGWGRGRDGTGALGSVAGVSLPSPAVLGCHLPMGRTLPFGLRSCVFSQSKCLVSEALVLTASPVLISSGGYNKIPQTGADTTHIYTHSSGGWMPAIRVLTVWFR